MAALVHRELRNHGVDLRLGEPLQPPRGGGGPGDPGGHRQGELRRRPGADGHRGAPRSGPRPGGGPGDRPDRAPSPSTPRMRTSDPAIFAAGDCAEATDLLSGRRVYVPLGSTANKQGRVVADNFAGRDPRIFPGILGSLIVKVFDLNVARTGLSEEDARLAGFDPETILAAVARSRPRLSRSQADRHQARSPSARAAVCSAPRSSVRGTWTNVSTAWPPPCPSAPPSTSWPTWTSPTLRPSPPPWTPCTRRPTPFATSSTASAPSLGPVAVREMRRNGDDFLFLDVRSPAEHAEVRIPGATLLPLGALRERLDELPPGPGDRPLLQAQPARLRGPAHPSGGPASPGCGIWKGGFSAGPSSWKRGTSKSEGRGGSASV